MKLFTLACLLVGAFLFVPAAQMLSQRPIANSSKAARRAYAEHLFAIAGIQVLCLVGAGVGAVLIVRKASAEYEEESLRNMKRLVETAPEE